MESVTESAGAKINLVLDVVGKRPDGYHDVNMVMQSLGLSDVLSVTRSTEPGITLEITGNDSLSAGEDNLVKRAFRLLAEEFGFRGGVRAVLEKKIPMAAGLAGGSADAAAMLRALNKLFGLELSTEKLRSFGSSLGADVPFCISGGTMLSQGIGDVLTPVCPMPECTLVIAKPSVDVSTGWAYGEIDRLEESTAEHSSHTSRDALMPHHPDVDAMVKALESSSLNRVADAMDNSFEPVIAGKYPVIYEIKSILKESGALNAVMSGSGPSVFGVFDGRGEAEKALERLSGSGIDLFVASTSPVFPVSQV